jgi:hypothetical protein
MRWLALALVCCVATTARAQSTQQDTGKAKPAMTKATSHKAGTQKMAAKSEAKGAMAEKPAAKTDAKGTDSAKGAMKPAAKHESKTTTHARKGKKSAKPDSTKKG